LLRFQPPPPPVICGMKENCVVAHVFSCLPCCAPRGCTLVYHQVGKECPRYRGQQLKQTLCTFRKRVWHFYLATSQLGMNGCCDCIGFARRGLSVPVTGVRFLPTPRKFDASVLWLSSRTLSGWPFCTMCGHTDNQTRLWSICVRACARTGESTSCIVERQHALECCMRAQLASEPESVERCGPLCLLQTSPHRPLGVCITWHGHASVVRPAVRRLALPRSTNYLVPVRC
jgi:hypothetical protein